MSHKRKQARKIKKAMKKQVQKAKQKHEKQEKQLPNQEMLLKLMAMMKGGPGGQPMDAATFLKLKEEAYIDECEYQLQITSLEQTVQNLKDMIAAIQNSETKLPVSNNNTTPDKVVAKTDFKYTTENGQVTITGYNGTNIDIEIPSNIDGLPVTSVGEEAFKNAMIRSVIIPSSVREIGWFAFSGCTCLESVNIPSSVLSIEYGTFDYCPKTMTVNCEKGSYAEAYALSWGIKVSAQ